MGLDNLRAKKVVPTVQYTDWKAECSRLNLVIEALQTKDRAQQQIIGTLNKNKPDKAFWISWDKIVPSIDSMCNKWDKFQGLWDIVKMGVEQWEREVLT